jgi:hypothetical protein
MPLPTALMAAPVFPLQYPTAPAVAGIGISGNER